MNIKQAKARFTELTGIEASSEALYLNAVGKQYLRIALIYVIDHSDVYKIDARYTSFWTLLNESIEKYFEIEEVA